MDGEESVKLQTALSTWEIKAEEGKELNGEGGGMRKKG